MKMRRPAALFLAAVLLLSLFGCAGMAGDKCYDNDGITVGKEMYSYFFNSFYRNFVSENTDTVTSLKLDTAKSLSEQKISETLTWYEYISSMVDEKISETVTLAAGAADAGVKLPDDMKNEVSETVSEYVSEAGKAGVSAAAYLAGLYGEGVTEEILRECLETEALAQYYKSELKKTITVTDEECEEYIGDNPEAFLRYDYLKMTVSKEDAQLLMSAYDRESFINNIRDIITVNNFGGNYHKFSEIIEEMTERCKYYGQKATPGVPLSDWMTDSSRKPFEIYSAEQSSGNILVAMSLPSPEGTQTSDGIMYRDNTPLKTVEYISFPDEESALDACGKDADALNKEDFASLKEKYKSETMDGIERWNCPDNLRLWLYAETRKPGDIGCIAISENETYIVMAGEDGDSAWKSEAKKSAEEKAYREKLYGIELVHPIEKNEELKKTVKGVTFEN